MIKAIFFDFDGVIVESLDIKTQAFAELFKDEGNEVVGKVVEYHLNNAGVSRYEKCRHIYSDMLNRELSDDRLQKLCDKFSKLVTDSVIKTSYVKGAIEFLRGDSSKYKCFIISATPQREIEHILRERGIVHYFKGVYGAPSSKGQSVGEVIKDYGLSPGESVYIGDALSDFEAAKRNSVKFIARIAGNQQIFRDSPCLKIEDLRKLQDLLESI